MSCNDANVDPASQNKIDITARRANTFELKLEVLENKLPYDFSNTDCFMRVKVPNTVGTSCQVLEFLSSNGTITTVGNVITLRQDAVNMSLKAGVYVYDFVVVDLATNDSEALFSGNFIVNESITL